MLDFIEKLIKLKTVENNNLEIEKAFDLCVNYFCDIKNDLYFHRIDNSNSLLISNCKDLDIDVLSTCHIDVVAMQNNIYNITKKDNNIIYGRGIFDMKSFIVSALYNLKKVIKQNINVKYGVLIVSNEELEEKSDTYLWSDKIKTKVVLDSDSGIGNINSIINNNLGSITIKLSKQDNDTIKLIKNFYSEFYCDVINNREIDILFNDKNIINNLKNLMKNGTDFEVLMFNDYIENDIKNKYNLLYKNTLETKLNKSVDYITSKTTTDSRFFSYKNINVINHQANGGNYHKIDEWLDYNSLIKFNDIQFEFLKKFISI